MKKQELLVLLGFVCLLALIALPLVAGCSSPASKPTDTAAPTSTGAPATVAAWAPTRFVTWLVGANPGGGFDTYSRGVAMVLPKYLGQDVVIKNVPGSGGATEAVQLYRSKPDGYTVGILDLEQRISESIIAKPEFEINKFTYLGAVNQYYSTLAVAAKAPWNTMEDMVKASQQKPIRLATQSFGAIEIIFPLVTGMKIQYVLGYNSGPECAVAIVRGDVDAMVYPDTTTVSFLTSKDLKGILHFGPTDSEIYKAAGISVPNASKGYPELTALQNTRGIAAPPGTPANIASALENALMKTLRDPALIDWSQKTNMPIVAMPAKELADVIKSQFSLYTKYKDALAAGVK